jgi:hypothetical protein
MEATGSAPLAVSDDRGDATRVARFDVIDGAGRCVRSRMAGPHAGSWLVTGLAPGRYEIVASGEAGVARVPLEVPSRRPTSVRLQRTAVLGRLEGAPDPAAWQVEWRPTALGSPGSQVRVDDDGMFRLPAEAGVRGRVVAWCDGPAESAGWAEAAAVSADVEGVVLHRHPGRELTGRVVGLPANHLHRFWIRWLHEGCAREAEVLADGAFRFAGLPEASAPLELVIGSRRFARWHAVASGRTDLVLSFPSADPAADDGAMEGLTPEPDGR